MDGSFCWLPAACRPARNQTAGLGVATVWRRTQRNLFGIAKSSLSSQQHYFITYLDEEKIMAHHALASQESYNPNHLLDILLGKMQLKNDAALSRLLEVAPPVISKIRHHRLPDAQGRPKADDRNDKPEAGSYAAHH